MAFGITRAELSQWKQRVTRGEIAFLTHYWLDARFPGVTTVTKVGCADLLKLKAWCEQHSLNPAYIHQRPPFPHFDLIGPRQKEILIKEELWEHISRFRL
ncbi:hypothetical protein NDK47_14160 [Brevibacillus ruminantium]|uniref:Uncharacterized protein n=1 Tax=Brevibacillus ruminantium TaxID=2950604 RepID=A0ABY4W904_9BACL|nr:hypothetical protein [Brevibacillus ruminantium]USG63331.1 hypothetical protein NDK47_14160 [Brevibacillus ruminantium]